MTQHEDEGMVEMDFSTPKGQYEFVVWSINSAFEHNLEDFVYSSTSQPKESAFAKTHYEEETRVFDKPLAWLFFTHYMCYTAAIHDLDEYFTKMYTRLQELLRNEDKTSSFYREYPDLQKHFQALEKQEQTIRDYKKKKSL